jgi:hypothetical protein
MERRCRRSNLAAPASGELTSAGRIEWVIGLDDDPVRRNLLITLSYHELAGRLAESLGAENANWCTFATWASRTAGRFIREDEVPRAFRILLGRFEPVRVTLARVNAALVRVDADSGLDADTVLEVVRDVLHDVAQLVAAGNLAVFGELGSLFTRMIDALAVDGGATALAGLAGLLSATLFSFNPAFGAGELLKSFVVVVLGGLGSVVGTGVAALILAVVEVFAILVLPSYLTAAVGFVMLVLVLVLRPGGLFGQRVLG